MSSGPLRTASTQARDLLVLSGSDDHYPSGDLHASQSPCNNKKTRVCACAYLVDGAHDVGRHGREHRLLLRELRVEVDRLAFAFLQCHQHRVTNLKRFDLTTTLYVLSRVSSSPSIKRDSGQTLCYLVFFLYAFSLL